MSQREKWEDYFELINHRKPTDDDYQQALANGELQAELTPEELWVKAFEERVGRAPNFEEVQAAAVNHFKLAILVGSGDDREKAEQVRSFSNMPKAEEPAKKMNKTAVVAIISISSVIALAIIFLAIGAFVSANDKAQKERAAASSSSLSISQSLSESRSISASSSSAQAKQAADAAQNQAAQAQMESFQPAIDDFLTQFYASYSGTTMSSYLLNYLENGAQTPGYSIISGHFDLINGGTEGKFDSFRFKYNHDVELSLVSATATKLVVNCAYSYVGFFWMDDKSKDGYESYHAKDSQIVIYPQQAGATTQSNDYTSYMRFASYDKNPTVDDPHYVPNMGYDAAN